MHVRFDLDLPFDATAPRRARAALVHWGVSRVAGVVVTELVMNALEHGRAPITLLAVVTGDLTHVEVRDARRDFGSRRDDSIGLRLVDAFSSAWGIAPCSAGKCVWAEFPPDFSG